MQLETGYEPLGPRIGEGKWMDTILFIEDEADIAQMMARVLRIEGYGVRVVKDCMGALEYLATVPKTSLILLDVMTAGSKDRWFLTKLEGDPQFRHIPVIAVNDRPISFTGVTDTVQKPFQWAKLLALIKQHVAG